MEVFIEVLGEIFFEGIFELIKNKKVSKFIRYPLLVLVCLFYMSILTLFLYIVISNFMQSKFVRGIISAAISLFVFVLFIYFFYKLLKK